MTGQPSGIFKNASRGDSRPRRVLHSVGEVALLFWILGVFWYYYESQRFGELVLLLVGAKG